MRVLIGAAGTTTGFGVARSLRAHWPSLIELVAADINPRELVAAATLADEFVTCPPVADPSYGAWLQRTLVERAPLLYLPLLDDDIAAAAALAGGDPADGVRVAAPPLRFADICADKLETHRWLAAHQLPTPDTWQPVDAEWTGERLLAKPRHGQGSAGVQVVSTEAELDALREQPGVIVQRRCEGPEVTIDCFRAAAGEPFRAVCRERLEAKAGICTKARVYEDCELAGLARAVAGGLELRGSSCIQVMRDPARGWVITDVNARPGGGTPMSTAAGVDVLGAALAELLELPFELDRALAPLAKPCFVVRQYEEYVV